PEVDELRVARGDALLLVRALAVEGERFERFERGDEHRAARRLVHAARLDADQAILDQVDAADAVPPPILLTVSIKAAGESSWPLTATGTPLSNSIVTFSGSSGASVGSTVSLNI